MKEETIKLLDTMTDNQILFIYTFLSRILGGGLNE